MPRGKRADIEATLGKRPFTVAEIRRLDRELFHLDVRRVPEAEEAVAGLERRLAALLARPDARHPGQRDNIAGLREELRAARARLLGAQVRAGEGGIVWHLGPREVSYDAPPPDPVAAARVGLAGNPLPSSRQRVPTMAITVRRAGQMVIFYGRWGAPNRHPHARVRDAFELLLDGEPHKGLVHTRRNVCRQAHYASMHGIGYPEPHVAALLLPRGTPGRHRKISRALRLHRKARKRARAGASNGALGQLRFAHALARVRYPS